MQGDLIPYGYCQCGCGQRTIVPRKTDGKYDVRGVPRKFRAGHQWRVLPGTAVERLERYSRLDVDTGCWVWTAPLSENGYGRINFRAASWPAHRLSYTLLVGPVPDDLHMDHLCRNRACINPAHLEPVTHAENLRRGLGGRLTTHCPQGHPYSPENTYIPPLPNKQGRQCRICKRAANARVYARKTGRAA
jgi:hypothetical protein